MYKSKLQELCQKRSWNLPVYSTQRDGPAHCPAFTTTLTVNEFEFSSPQNGFNSSKESQNAAAKLAFNHLSSSLPADDRMFNPTSLASPSVSNASIQGLGSSNVVSDQNPVLHQDDGGNLDIPQCQNKSDASSNKGTNANEPTDCWSRTRE